MASKGKKVAPKAKSKPKKAQSARVINLPLDLCPPSDVTAGFDQLEPIINHGSTMLIATDVAATPKTLAADSLCHLVEGWRYLASAMYAFLAHASGASVHQAYYAELRAIFSLFSASGIRIRFPAHEYLNDQGTTGHPSWKKAPTHTLAWELWNDWVRCAFADKLFSDDLKIHPSITVRQLQQSIQVLSPAASLKAWGFDLATLRDDHLARNTASYEAYWTMQSLTTMSTDDFTFVTELWQQLQPTSSGLQFETSLVHYLIDLEIAGQNELDPVNFSEAHWYNSLISSLGASTGVGIGDLAALLLHRPSSTRPFQYANEQKTEARNVLSRALFLLRLATLAADKNFAAYPASTGKRWMKNWLAHAGLWDDKCVPAPADVWADFEDLLQATSPGLPLPYKIFNETVPTGILGRLVRPDVNLAWSLPL